ncbi:hypothetical protein WJX77_002888 [Trebouxia sp. C0004]
MASVLEASHFDLVLRQVGPAALRTQMSRPACVSVARESPSSIRVFEEAGKVCPSATSSHPSLTATSFDTPAEGSCQLCLHVQELNQCRDLGHEIKI